MTRYKRIIFLPFLAIFIFFNAFAQDNNQDLIDRAGCSDKFPGANLLTIYDSTSVDVQESGLSYVTMHKLVKVLTAAGAKSSRQITLNYDPQSAYVEFRAARIYRKDGSVDTLDISKAYDYPAPARMIYWGARDLTLEIGRLEPGDALETVIFRKGFTYALLMDEDDKFIPPMKGHFYDIVNFWSGQPVLEKVYKVAVPPDKPLQYEVYNGELGSYIHFNVTAEKKPVVRINPHKIENKVGDARAAGEINRSGKTVYCWFKNDIMPFQGEPDMIAHSDVATKLLISTSPDWYAKAVWFHGVNEDYGSFEVTPEVQKKTDELLKGVGDEMEKIKILTHWVAEEIRYSGISMGEGEGYTLHKGEMTFLDRCGVCKDKAGMLVTMLRAAGFESYPAMTMAGSRIDRIPADQFNHSVTLAKLDNGDWILLDPTWVPGVRELWSSAEQQQQYLMGIPGGSDLMTTPISPPANHYWKLKGNSELHSDGKLTGTLRLEAEGQSDALIRRAFLRNFHTFQEEYLPELFSRISPYSEIQIKNMTGPGDISEPLSIELEYSIPDYAVITDEKIIFTPLAARNPFMDYFNASEMTLDTSLAERKYGFRIRCSKLVEISEKIRLPKYKSAIIIPGFEAVEKGNEKGKTALFKAGYKLEGRELVFNMKHEMEKRLYEAEDWPLFRKAMKERFEAMNEKIVLKK